MSKKLSLLLVLVLGSFIASSFLSVVITAQEPTATPAPATQESTVVFQANPGNLHPCGYYKDILTFHKPEPVTPKPSNTPDPNAATPTQLPPTNTPRPAPNEDRVGFPKNYETDFKLLFVFNRPDRKLVRAICGNDVAALRKAGEAFPYGSILVMISHSAQLDEKGQPMLDEKGHYIGERPVALHVQRKEKGFGEAYGADRAGEWEFMAYNFDGSVQTAPQNTNFCAVCHSGEGGKSVDFAFRMNLFYEGESAFTAPPVKANEISIYFYNFAQPVREVKTGNTITWVNNDEATHHIVAAVVDDKGKIVRAEKPLFESAVLASNNIKPRDSFSFTFEKPGEYLYRCTIHENMTGKIIVTN
jgi:plastocyanin